MPGNLGFPVLVWLGICQDSQKCDIPMFGLFLGIF